MKHKWAAQFSILSGFILVFGFISAFSGPEIGYDFAHYHFYNGYAFVQSLKNGHFFQDAAPAGLWSYFNPLIDAGMYLLLTHTSAWWASFWIGAPEGLLGFFAYLLSRQIFEKKGVFPASVEAWLALALGLSSSIVLSQIGTTHGDLPSALFLMAGLCLAGSRKRSFYQSFSVGLLIGISVGLKLTEAPFVLGVLISYGIFYLFKKEVKISTLVTVLMGSGLGFLLVDGFWLWMLYQKFFNPFFPYWNDIFHSPYFSMESSQDPTYIFHFFSDYWLFPFRWMAFKIHANGLLIADPRLAVCFVLAGWVFLSQIIPRFRMRLSSEVLFLTIFLLSSYVIWGGIFGILRYAVPMLLVSSILLVYFLAIILERFIQNSSFRQGIFLTIIIGAMVFTVPLSKNAQPVSNAFHRPYVYLQKAPQLPLHSMIILSSSNQLWKGGATLVLPLLHPEISVFPNFYPNDSLYFREGFLRLKMPNSLNLSVSKILHHQGAIFVLFQINQPDLQQGTLTEEEQRLIPLKNRCQEFETSVEWIGRLALCEVKVKYDDQR